MERKTLLLNANYFPVQILHWQTACKLKWEGTADVLVEYEEEISSPSLTWKLPAVMRLRRKVAKDNKRPVRFSRAAVYLRDAYFCQYCGKNFTHTELTLDHVTPRWRGGQTTWENVCSCCKKCNASKGGKTCDEWGKWPINKPVAPRDHAARRLVVDSTTSPAEWSGFVT